MEFESGIAKNGHHFLSKFTNELFYYKRSYPQSETGQNMSLDANGVSREETSVLTPC